MGRIICVGWGGDERNGLGDLSVLGGDVKGMNWENHLCWGGGGGGGLD